MWLASNRRITAIGVDTLSLDKIPPRGATAYIGLIPWERGSGGPCRVLAVW